MVKVVEEWVLSFCGEILNYQSCLVVDFIMLEDKKLIQGEIKQIRLCNILYFF